MQQTLGLAQSYDFHGNTWEGPLYFFWPEISLRLATPISLHGLSSNTHWSPSVSQTWTMFVGFPTPRQFSRRAPITFLFAPMAWRFLFSSCSIMTAAFKEEVFWYGMISHIRSSTWVQFVCDDCSLLLGLGASVSFYSQGFAQFLTRSGWLWSHLSSSSRI